MATRRRYSRIQKAAAVGEAVATSAEAASERLGIPRRTIGYWLTQPEFAELRQKTREDVAEKYWAALQVGIDRIVELIPVSEDLQKVSVAVGVLHDKHALLTGGATGRTESRELNDLPDSTYVAAIREAKRLAQPARPDGEAAEEPEG